MSPSTLDVRWRGEGAGRRRFASRSLNAIIVAAVRHRVYLCVIIGQIHLPHPEPQPKPFPHPESLSYP